MEEFEYKGLWWLPQFPNHTVAGTLKFHATNGILLEIVGNTFINQIAELYGYPDPLFPSATVIPENKVIDIICGYTNGGDPVTLYKCAKHGGNVAIGYVGEKYQIQNIFIGCHFEKDEDIVFDSISLRYTHIEQWLGITGFDGGFNRSNTGEYLEGEIKYTPPDHIEVSFDGFTIAINHSLRVTSDMFIDFHMRQLSFIEIKSNQPMHYQKYQSNVIHDLRNFLSLGIGQAILPLVMIGKNKKCTILGSNDDKIPRDVYIFYTSNSIGLELKKQIHTWDMLFRYQDIADEFQRHLLNWFNKSKQLRPVMDLYFGILYIPSMYIHLEFLTLAQALETYHRRMYGGIYLSTEQYEPIRQALVQAIPNGLDDAHRSSLKSRIQYGYEYSLRKRIKLILNDVLADYRQIVDTLIGDHGEFIGRLVDTRNYLTHYTEELEQTAITEPEKQYAFVQKMKLLMQLCFFAELGISTEVVSRLMSNNRKYQFWSR